MLDLEYFIKHQKQSHYQRQSTKIQKHDSNRITHKNPRLKAGDFCFHTLSKLTSHFSCSTQMSLLVS